VSAVPIEFDVARVTDHAEVVRATALCKSIDGRAVLDEVYLRIPAGSFVALLGANGAGKSTLLKVLATLSPPTSGRLELFGRPATATGRGAEQMRRSIGLIGHQSMLYRDLSARERTSSSSADSTACPTRAGGPNGCSTPSGCSTAPTTRSAATAGA
jgi:ABC-type transporter Mla maintaining outer membrane lipid asymmetry ATPase subunit MlaF